MGQNKPKGFVMVIGGGIAGIQAALSLVDAGYGIYLVERSESLGGMIPDLHRIYPLCACCKLDPRITACGQNPNIKVMLKTNVVNVTGNLGNFSVTLKNDDREERLAVGSIILATGIEAFDPVRYETYSYGRLPNVITSVEYEQRQKPLGPEGGVIKRPSDGKTPEKIAWLQCVGSRDINQCDAPYCSSVCCMYALKEAVNTKDFSQDIETAIFYMDMRTHGKGFEEYLNDAVSRDVRLIRSRVHTVDPAPESDDLLIIYADESGQLMEERFDMVVLSVGLRPSAETTELAEKIGLDISDDKFIDTARFNPVSTNIPGIFVCGGVSGPFDIGQSLAQASATVSEISCILAPEPFSPPVEYPKPSSAKASKPKILLAYNLCPGMPSHVGSEIEEYAKSLPGVAAVTGVQGDILGSIMGALQNSKANRLVFTSCSPSMHKDLIEEALKLTGLNPYLYETVDLRVMPLETSAQLKDRIRMGVARVSLITPPSLKEIPVVKRALVIGGGVSGLESALAIANEGYPVTLVEKEKDLGGHGRHVRVTWQGYDAQEYLRKLLSSVEENKNITVMSETQVRGNRGFAGNFVTTVARKGKNKDISHGVTILASGGDPVKPEEYLYGKEKNVLLWSELSQKMIDNPSFAEDKDTVVFIQCVGSRESARPYCSNLCCSFSVRTALDMKAANPDINVFVLYRDMRTFGERENIYREAREKGVIFIRYEPDNKPVVEPVKNSDSLQVTVYDQVLEKDITLKADLVSLQTAIAGTNNQPLADIFRVNLDPNGFLAESPEKMKPVDTTVKGIYSAGLALYPKDTNESIVQAKAASARALEILTKDTVQIGGMIAEVMPEKCAVCCTCVRTCPFGIPVIDKEIGAAYIDPGLCQGCGICVAECPGKAIIMATCSDQMLNEAPSILLKQA